jgi:hypothetical protein
MNPALVALPAAFGLAGATGLNATLPLLIVSLLARLGLIHLAPPYDALQSDVAFYGLIALAVVEFAIDKVPALDSVGHAVMLPVAAAAGAILFASQTGAVSSMDSGLAVLVSLLGGGRDLGDGARRSGNRPSGGQPRVSRPSAVDHRGRHLGRPGAGGHSGTPPRPVPPRPGRARSDGAVGEGAGRSRPTRTYWPLGPQQQKR